MVAARPGYFATLLSHWRSHPGSSLAYSCAAIASGWGIATYQLRDRSPPRLNPTHFTPYTLIATHTVSSTSAIFTLRPPTSKLAAEELKKAWEEGDNLWSVQVKQPHLQIGREYTPLPPSAVLDRAAHELRVARGDLGNEQGEDASADIHLLIRREKMGTMTKYLHSLPINAPVGLRGPYRDVEIPHNVDEVLFLAGGTGISPALQVANILARRPGSKMHILWANRRRDECQGASLVERTSSSGILSSISSLWSSGDKSTSRPEELAAAKTLGEKGLVVKVIEEMRTRVPKGSFDIQYFVDEEDIFIKQRDVRKILDADQSVASAVTSSPGTDQKNGTKLIIVSGPDGFVDYWAGKKRMTKDGLEIQGPLEGRLGQLELHGWNVWKL